MDHRLPGQPLGGITVNVSMDDLHRNPSFHIDTMQLTDRTMTVRHCLPCCSEWCKSLRWLLLSDFPFQFPCIFLKNNLKFSKTFYF